MICSGAMLCACCVGGLCVCKIQQFFSFSICIFHIFCKLASKNCSLVERSKLCEAFKYIIVIRAKIINLQGHYLPILFLRTSAGTGETAYNC